MHAPTLPLRSPIAQLVEVAATLAVAVRFGPDEAVPQALTDLVSVFEVLDSSRVEKGWRAVELLVAAFDAGAEDGEHPGDVDWEDIEAAERLARQALGRTS